MSSHLTPHPWDALGKPPQPGPNYVADDLSSIIAYIKAIDECRLAEEMVDEAQDDLDTADEKLRKAEVHAETLKAPVVKYNARLQMMIEDDPTAKQFGSAQSLREWLDAGGLN